MLGFRSLKATPETVSGVPEHCTKSKLTQHVSILGKEGGICPKVDTTPDNVQRAKFWPIILARRGVAENLPIVAMVGVRVRLPTWYSAQSDFGA